MKYTTGPLLCIGYLRIGSQAHNLMEIAPQFLSVASFAGVDLTIINGLLKNFDKKRLRHFPKYLSGMVGRSGL